VTPIQGGAQIYTALQTHLVDGLDQALVGVENFKFYEVQKYVSVTNHIWTGATMVASGTAWQRLPGQLQQLVERTFDAAALQQRADMMRSDQTYEGTLKGHGMIFSDADLPAFKTVLRNAGLYTQWRDGIGAEPWSLLERAVGKLP
jgi:TRAP-type transport system periplasmic protein